ncbi:lysoplasmalogenase [Brucepastera parasyntrophica]|uniref:lysoplasmalogenase family protein n=1 Tax=Brucepastera parasyntrophica TaxID=2880008 RepID=UPI00210B2A2E|nr:lysoplasmalogenase family protein [Brucepastera parasyntrophica]ULQ59444.1 lysoplasmalogenase [Brucepastera parasyntrophica]
MKNTNLNSSEKIISYVYLAVSAVFYAVIVAFKIFSVDAVRYVIPAFVVVVFLYSLTATFRQTWLISLALLFVVIGDVLLNLTPVGDLAIVSFSVTHICLTIFYVRKKPFEKKDMPFLIPFALIAVLYYCVVFNDIPQTVAILKFVLPVYLCLLALMAWRALCLVLSDVCKLERKKITIGSTLFYATDLLVFLQIIYGHPKMFVVGTWILYPPALVLLSTFGKRIFSSIKHSDCDDCAEEPA